MQVCYSLIDLCVVTASVPNNIGYERLVVVTLHRGHQYMSLDAVKEEVSSKAVEFLQTTATSTKKVNTLWLELY